MAGSSRHNWRDEESISSVTVTPDFTKAGSALVAASRVGKWSKAVARFGMITVFITAEEMNPRVPSEPIMRWERICAGVS